jgi:hypothetical protein
MKLGQMMILLMLAACVGLASAQETAVVTPASEAAEGLDLQAVGELFKDAENLEEFEKALNDPETGVNNLDLDDNGEVDYIRVIEEVYDDTHIIILQVPLGEDEYQDVATIEVEKSGDDEYNMQVSGNEDIYGEDYYVAPSVVHIHTWPIIAWMYRPAYRPYVSVYRFGYYPRWWVRRRPVTVTVYNTRLVRYRKKPVFVHTRTRRVTHVRTVRYKPRSSRLVKKRTVVRTPRGKVVRTKTVKKPARRRR